MINYRRIFYPILACMVLLSTLWAQEIALTSDDWAHYCPQWSPDGNWIVYQKLDATGYDQIYKVPSSGGTEIALTNDGYNHYNPQWSPDGSWIVYYKNDATGHYQIYKVPSAGGTEIALTNDGYHHCNPQWSPDGNWIVYDKYDATYNWQIYKLSSPQGIEISPSTSEFCILKIKPTITASYGVVIDYCIKRKGRVCLRTYNIAGEMIKELVNKEVTPGNYTIRWDGSNHTGVKVTSGHYFVRLESGKFSRTEKVIVMR
ncbi:PD40 domain-containing protein [candidate division WOR-3 bacterium]|nr:PD40 domain-containing protein [candidate division WOR-3 bacterium]